MRVEGAGREGAGAILHQHLGLVLAKFCLPPPPLAVIGNSVSPWAGLHILSQVGVGGQAQPVVDRGQVKSGNLAIARL